MNTLETISNRRSVRSFADKPIPKETLLTLIKAGSLAPTGANAQPFIIPLPPSSLSSAWG